MYKNNNVLKYLQFVTLMDLLNDTFVSSTIEEITSFKDNNITDVTSNASGIYTFYALGCIG